MGLTTWHLELKKTFLQLEKKLSFSSAMPSPPLLPPVPASSGELPMKLHDKEEQPMAVVMPPPAKRKRGRKGKEPAEEKQLARVMKPSDEVCLQLRIISRDVRILFDSLRLNYQFEFIKKSKGRSSSSTRHDLEAFNLMKGLEMVKGNTDKRVLGPVLGVEIGDIFFYRAEMSLVGIHAGNLMAGIQFAPAEFTEKREPVALSVVDSGGYQENQEVKDGVLLYTGSGGKGQNDSEISYDQTLKNGNLALATSYKYNTEIRVIYGITQKSYGSARILYIYDGLYRVVNYKQEKNSNGNNNIFRFELVRIQGQEESGIKLVRYAKEVKGKLNEGTVPSGYLTGDISKGKEKIPVPYFNDIDSFKGPMELEYLKSPKYPSPSKKSALKGCECKKVCDKNCICLKRNNGSFAYDNNGILLQGRPIIYECGDTCQCSIGCQNRVTQKGMKYQLEIFRSLNNVFSVRSLDPIQAGTFICEISGDFILREMVNEYHLSLLDPLNFSESWKKWGDLSKVLNDWKFTELPLRIEEPGYFLETSRRVNVGGYFGNNQIMPNLFVQYVLYSHDNVRFPRMMVFALENIPPFRELSLEWFPVIDPNKV